MPVHLISVSISVELWLIGSSCPKHCIWSHIGLQDLLQEGHIFNVQTALKGQWNEDWLSVLQENRLGQNRLATWNLWSPSHQDWPEENEAQVPSLPFPVSYGLPIKVRICFDSDRKKKKRKGELIPSCSKVFKGGFFVFFFVFFYYHLHLLNIRLEC